MKTLKYISGFAIAAVMLASCNDLDTEPLGSTVTADQKNDVLKADPEMAEAALLTIAQQMQNRYSIWSSRNDIDFGVPSIMVGLDNRGMDVFGTMSQYDFYQSETMFADIRATSNFTNLIWRTLYKQIYVSNGLIKTIDYNTQDPKLMNYLAQALGVRAFDYFWLAQLYQQPYMNNQTQPCVPIITNENEDEASANGAPRATVEEVYAQILKDLDKAIELFDALGVNSATDRLDKRFLNGSNARGLRARVYMNMNRWADAAADAQYAIQHAGATPYSVAQLRAKACFWDAADASWIWAITVEETDDVASTPWCNFGSMMSSLQYGYTGDGDPRSGNHALIDGIPNTDVRKGWWLDSNGTSQNLTAAEKAWLAYEGYDSQYINVKFGAYNNNPETKAYAGDIPLMRIEEMYLILAEAQAMGGNPGAGATTLSDFVKANRDPQYTFTGSSAEAVQEEVFRQRRIELWGEGLIWFDIMRLNKAIDRRGGGYPAEATFLIPSGDAVRIFQIPQGEMEANNAITENNPVGTAPRPVTE